MAAGGDGEDVPGAAPGADGTVIRLSHDEAAVLAHLLHRWMDREHGRAIRAHIEDDAELWALNALNCLLERADTAGAEAFTPDHDTLVRARLREENGGAWAWSDEALGRSTP